MRDLIYDVNNVNINGDVIGAPEMEDEPCRSVQSWLQSVHEVRWNANQRSVPVVQPLVDKSDRQRLECGRRYQLTDLT